MIVEQILASAKSPIIAFALKKSNAKGILGSGIVLVIVRVKGIVSFIKFCELSKVGVIKSVVFAGKSYAVISATPLPTRKSLGKISASLRGFSANKTFVSSVSVPAALISFLTVASLLIVRKIALSSLAKSKPQYKIPSVSMKLA